MLRIRLLVLLFLSSWNLAAKIDTVSAGDREIIRIRPGVMVRTTELWTMGNSSFDSDVGLRLGVEYERLFPAHAVSWGLLFEPAFESFSTAKATLFQPEVIAEVNYQAIDLNVGIRCYLAPGDGSRIALSVGTCFPILLHSQISYYYDYPGKPEAGMPYEFRIDGIPWSAGLGWWRKRLGVELRYSARKIAPAPFGGSLNGMDLLVSYTLLSLK